MLPSRCKCISMTIMLALINFGGLPGTGKTAIARERAREFRAADLRIDSIEQVIRSSGTLDKLLEDQGYCVAGGVAEDNLRLGRTVVVDCVNPLKSLVTLGFLQRIGPKREP